MTLTLITLILIGALIACIALGGLIFSLTRRTRRGLPFWIVALVVAFLLAGGAGLTLVLRLAGHAATWVSHEAAAMQAADAARQVQAAAHKKEVAAHIALMDSGVSPDLRATEPPDFYTYDGFRDWWRIPLRFPFELQAIDTLDYAQLGKYSGDGKVDNPAVAFSSLGFDGITHVACDAHFLLIRRVSFPRESNQGPVRWTLFNFDRGEGRTFDTREELLKAAAAAGYHGDTNLKTLQEWYDASF